MLRRTSKRVREVVDKMRPSAVVRLSRSFWDEDWNGVEEEKLEFVLRHLEATIARCLIVTLELPGLDMHGQEIERLAGESCFRSFSAASCLRFLLDVILPCFLGLDVSRVEVVRLCFLGQNACRVELVFSVLYLLLVFMLAELTSYFSAFLVLMLAELSLRYSAALVLRL